jgi:hypothetical protein
LDDATGNYNVYCAKLTRKELRINSTGEIILCDTLRKPLIMFDKLERLEDFNKIPELIAMKHAIKQSLPCCKRCCKSTGLAATHEQN